MTRMRLRLVFIGALLVAGFGAVPALAQTGGGSISGTIVDEGTGDPLCATVVVFDTAGNELTQLRPFGPDQRGDYTVPGVPAGEYLVRFEENCAFTHRSEWFHDKADMASADVVVVQEGADTAGVDGRLARIVDTGGWISGTITDQATGLPLDAVASAIPLGATEPTQQGYTDGNGAYRIGFLGTGDYHVKFEATGMHPAVEWYDDQPGVATAVVISVVEGAEVTGIDAAIALPVDNGGWISGRVTDAATGAPLEGICAEPHDEAGERIQVFDGFTQRSNADGVYRLTGLGTGAVRIQFIDCAPFVYEDQWWSGKADFASADAILVQEGVEVTGIDVAMSLPVDGGGWITGRITDAATGEPVAGICPTAYGENGDWISTRFYQRSNDDGVYRLGGLGTRTIRLAFDDCGPFLYESQWWSGKADFASADPITAQEGVEITGIDVAMSVPVDEGGWITGRITDAETGQPLEGICPLIYDEDGNSLYVDGRLYHRSDADGIYQIGGIGTAVVRVEFVDCAPFVYEDQWWSGKTDFASADPISVEVGVAVRGIDAAMILKFGATRPPPPPPPPPVEPPGGIVLLETGSSVLPMLWWALALVGGGGALVFASSVRPGARPQRIARTAARRSMT